MPIPDQILTTDAVTAYRNSINGRAANIPPILADLPMVQLEGYGVTVMNGALSLATNSQAAQLRHLPHTINGATRLRWKYQQPASAVTTSYNIGIYSAAGALLVSTGSLAYTGANNTLQARSETIASTNFPVGMYYVVFGVGTVTGGQPITCGYQQGSQPAAHMALARASGGITLPANMSGFGDIVTNAIDTPTYPVPFVTLSVG